MEIGPYLGNIRHQLEVAAEAGGDENRAAAERLVAPLDAAIRLALLDVLAAAADEITVELAPGSVQLRLRGRDPEFVVTPPPADPSGEGTTDPDDEGGGWTGATVPAEGDEGSTARINLRMPEQLKARIERAAASSGLSVNSWLVRATAAALERGDQVRSRERRAPMGAQRYTGWAR
jgi:uncharacterized protein (DUF1778 family)